MQALLLRRYWVPQGDAAALLLPLHLMSVDPADNQPGTMTVNNRSNAGVTFTPGKYSQIGLLGA